MDIFEINIIYYIIYNIMNSKKYKTKDMGEFFFNIHNPNTDKVNLQPTGISRKEDRQPIQSQDKMFYYQRT